jgi:hypothetical protein
MAYTATVTSPMDTPERISRSLGLYAGTVTIDSYNTTLVEITGITRYFKTGTGTILCVTPSGPTDSGYNLTWNFASNAFKAVLSSTVAIPVDSAVGGSALLFDSGGGAGALHATSAVGSIVLAGAVFEEAANDDDIGSVSFIAIGFV